MNILVFFIWLIILIYLSFTVFYHSFLAIVYLLTSKKRVIRKSGSYKYLLLIPAHNEETVIGRLLESLEKVDFHTDWYEINVIADNCTDKTIQIVHEYSVQVMERKDPLKKGKGFAIEWALSGIDIARFDAVVIIDADNIVDENFFWGLNEILDQGINAVQCYNGVANPEESLFTRIMHLSRTIDNELFHQAKYKLGLSSYLMGNGMCFTSRILKEIPWRTHTMAEDYEYYARLVDKGETIGFALNARLYHQESSGIRQATEQRTRWSSGRLEIAYKYGIKLFIKGIKKRNYKMVDASFPLILPNLSLMVNMTIISFIVALFTQVFFSIFNVTYWIILLLIFEMSYFTSGIYLTRMSVWKFICAFLYIPFFLIWKGCIDLKAVFGKRVRKWGTSKRG